MRYAATLAAGLRPSSRSHMRACGVKATLSESLDAMQYDTLQAIAGMLTGKKQHYKPIAKTIIYGKHKDADKGSYEATTDFEAEWQKRMKKLNGGEDHG